MPRNKGKASKDNASKRGVKASKYVFTEEQDKIIRNYCENLKANIHDHLKDPNKPLRDTKLTSWKQSTAEEILGREEFSTLDMTIHNEDGWKFGIMNRFTNYFNSVIKPTLLTGSNNWLQSSDTAEPDRLLRTFALLSNDLSGREYYARKNDKLLQDKTAEIYEDQCHKISKGTARNRALNHLWNNLISSEKNDWKERAEAYAMDIESNRKDFPDVIEAALQTVVERGRLGTGIVGLCYAFRSEDGEIDSGSVQVGTNVITGKRLFTKVKNVEWQSIWRDHAHEVLPLLPPKEESLVKLSKEDATPIFPQIMLKKETPEKLALIVEDYITKLWAKASPANPGSIVLWDRINDEAEFYYDNEKFKLPGKLRPAAQYDDVPELCALVKYFDQQQRVGDPFKFTRLNELLSDSEPEDPPHQSEVSTSFGTGDTDHESVKSSKTGPVKKARRVKSNISTQAAENKQASATTGNKQDPAAPRTLRKRDCTGHAIASTPPKRLADLPEVEAAELMGVPGKRRKGHKGWAIVQFE